MQKWVKKELIEKGAPTMRASVKTFKASGEIECIIVPSSIWVLVKNGEWIRRAILDGIGVVFNGAQIAYCKGSIFIYSERFSYRLKTYPKRRLTATTKKGKNECE